MSISIPSVNIRHVTSKPYSKKRFEYSTIFINISPNVENSFEHFFKYNQTKEIFLENDLDNSIKAYFDNGGFHLYLLNYNLNGFKQSEFEEYIKRVCDGLVEIEVIATPTLLSTSTLDIDNSIRVLSFLGEYANQTDRIFVMDVNEIIIKDYLDMLHDGVIYYPWFKNKKGELVAPSSVATGLMSKLAKENSFFHSIANKGVMELDSLDFELTKEQTVSLQKDLINPILYMHNDGPKIWGVNAFNSKFKTINEVRIIKYIKRNLKLSMRDNLFEVNSPKLKDKVFSKVNNFLTALWELGALAGESKDEAFVIETKLNNDENKLVFHIGVALSKPLEFINIKLERVQKDGMSQNISVEV